MRKATLLLTTCAVLVAVVAWFGLQAQAQRPEKQPAQAGHHGHEMFDRCAKACNDCQRLCDHCGTHCAHLAAKGMKEHLHTMMTCQDCADFCSTAAQIVARRGAFADLVCKSCAEACARCGKACEQHPNDPMMKRCAEECRRCEQACREMLKHVEQRPVKTE